MHKRIRSFGKDKCYGKSQLAEILKISQATYSRYENGLLEIPTEVLIELTKFYGVSADRILGLVD